MSSVSRLSPKVAFLCNTSFGLPCLRRLHTMMNYSHQMVVVTEDTEILTWVEELNTRLIWAKELASGVARRNTSINPLIMTIRWGEAEFLRMYQEFDPDIAVVLGFKILPKEIIEVPRRGTYNLHASLLPQLKGANPIEWAIIAGHSRTGISMFRILPNVSVDGGEVIASDGINITADDTFDTISRSLSELTAPRVLQMGLQHIYRQETPTIELPNEDEEIIRAPKISASDPVLKIDWYEGGQTILNLVRGLSRRHRPWCYIPTGRVLIWEVEFEENQSKRTPGIYETDGKKYLRYTCQDGAINITSLQLPGKKRLGIKQFLAGYREW